MQDMNFQYPANEKFSGGHCPASTTFKRTNNGFLSRHGPKFPASARLAINLTFLYLQTISEFLAGEHFSQNSTLWGVKRLTVTVQLKKEKRSSMKLNLSGGGPGGSFFPASGIVEETAEP